MVAKQRLLIALNISPAGSLLAPAELLPGCTGWRGYVRGVGGLRAGLIGAEKRAGAWRIPPFFSFSPWRLAIRSPPPGRWTWPGTSICSIPAATGRSFAPGVGPADGPHPIAGGREAAAASVGAVPPHAGKLSGLLRRGPACGSLACVG